MYRKCPNVCWDTLRNTPKGSWRHLSNWSVPNCTVHWAKNKCMFPISVTCFIFNLQRRNIFYFPNETCIINYWMYSILWIFQCINNPLTWNYGSLYVAAKFCPCGPHAQSQLSHFKDPYPTPHCPSFPPLPINTCKYYNTDKINTPSLFLSGISRESLTLYDRPKSIGSLGAMITYVLETFGKCPNKSGDPLGAFLTVRISRCGCLKMENQREYGASQ